MAMMLDRTCRSVNTFDTPAKQCRAAGIPAAEHLRSSSTVTGGPGIRPTRPAEVPRHESLQGRQPEEGTFLENFDLSID
ncbi:hypothetical protein ACWEPB_36560, partial [Kitasatospora cineracea]